MTNRVIDHEESLNVNTPEIFSSDYTPWETYLKHHSPLNEVPGLVAIPSLDIIRQAFGLHHLSVTAERKIVDKDTKAKLNLMRKAGDHGKFPRESSLPLSSRRLMRKAIIRSFACAATLAEYYTQPLDRCRAYYNYLRATRWINEGNGLGLENDNTAAAEAFHGAYPPGIQQPNDLLQMVEYAAVVMALIGYDHNTTKIDPCHADYLRMHAVYYTDVDKTTFMNNVDELVKQATIFCRLEQWLMYSILSDKAGRARFATRFRDGVGRGTICPGEDKCELSLMHIPLGNTHHLEASWTDPDTYTHADAHFIV